MNLYITDRGVDNAQDPHENDGRIYEIAIGSATRPARSRQYLPLVAARAPQHRPSMTTGEDNING
jgi:hypothetical protein